MEESVVKKLLCVLLALMLPLMLLAGGHASGNALAEGEVEPLYRAKVKSKCNLRAEPNDSARFLKAVSAGESVDILEWGDAWSLCSYGGKTGWLKTVQFYEIWRLGDEPLPGMLFLGGVATIEKATHVENMDKSSGDLFNGLELQPGDVIAAVGEDGRIPFRRAVLTLPEGAYTYTPFAAVEDAQPGDMIYAFTTYYNEGVGGDLARQRRANISLAVERLSGLVLQMDEQFSFNAVCGPYELGNGYVKGPNLSHSGVGVGGGVCQVSTTIFEAVLGLELQLDQWEVHQVAGVKYAPQNFDAAVGSRKDLKFTNTLPYPIRLEVRTQNGALTAYFYRAE